MLNTYTNEAVTHSPKEKSRPRFVDENDTGEDLNIDIKIPNFLIGKSFNKNRWIYRDEDQEGHELPTITYWNNKEFSTHKEQEGFMVAMKDISKIKKLMTGMDKAKLRKFFYSRKQTEYLIRWIFKIVMRKREDYFKS